MTYFLDTNICIYFLKAQSKGIKNKMLSLSPSRIKIPSIVKAELLYGAEKSRDREKNLAKVQQFLFPLEIIGFNDKESETYGQIRAYLEKQGKKIGPNDLLIASTVLANNGILITHNAKEFERVPELKTEDWF